MEEEQEDVEFSWDDLSASDEPEDWALAFTDFVNVHKEAMTFNDVVNWFNHAMTAAKAFQWREDSKDLIGTQEMLGHVLRAVGGQVVITQEQLTSGHKKGAQILIEEDVLRQGFIFKLEEPNEY